MDDPLKLPLFFCLFVCLFVFFLLFFKQNAVLFHVVNNNWTMEIFIPDFYIYPKRNILFECIPINSLTIQKYVSQKSQSRLYFIKNIDTWKQNRCTPFLQGETYVTIRRFPKTDRFETIELYSFEL